MTNREKDVHERPGRDDSSNHYDESGDRGHYSEGEKSGGFRDRVEKLERPGEWPDPPTEKKE